MKTKLAGLVLVFAVVGMVEAAPIAFNEVSLLVRMKEKENYIVQQVEQRRLLRGLTAEQEAKLKADGASENLLQALRKPDAVLPAAEATAFEDWSAEQKAAIARKLAAEEARREAEEAARATAEAEYRRDQDIQAARDRALAQAQDQYYSDLAASSDYYGGYGYGGYGGSYGCVPGDNGFSLPGRGGGFRPTPRSLSAGSLRWSNGTATTHVAPGLSYYPLGSNGSGNVQFGNGAGMSFSSGGHGHGGMSVGGGMSGGSMGGSGGGGHGSGR